MNRFLIVFFFCLYLVSEVHAYEEPAEVSTQPIGSPFLRHLAHDFDQDLRDLVKLEKRGFGRAETITLIFISSAIGKTPKDLAKRRLKEKISLRELTAEAGLDYQVLYKKVGSTKEEIESRGDKNLPPPVFEEPTMEPTPKSGKKKKKQKGKIILEASPSPKSEPESEEKPTPNRKVKKSEIDL